MIVCKKDEKGYRKAKKRKQTIIKNLEKESNNKTKQRKIVEKEGKIKKREKEENSMINSGNKQKLYLLYKTK